MNFVPGAPRKTIDPRWLAICRACQALCQTVVPCGMEARRAILADTAGSVVLGMHSRDAPLAVKHLAKLEPE